MPTTSECFNRILEQYLPARNTQQFAQNPIREQFTSVCHNLEDLAAVRLNPQLSVEWSAGKGNWAKVPWIAFLNHRETSTTQFGVYGVFLFCQDMTGVYLTLAQGVTRLIKDMGRTKAQETLRDRATSIAVACTPLLSRGFKTDANIDLKADAGLGADYQSSTIAYKFFPAETFQDESCIASFNEDIESLLHVYRGFIENKQNVNEITHLHHLFEIHSKFDGDCTPTACGLSFGGEKNRKFIASLAAKPFLVLTGLSGSGKTKLAQAFVRWLTPDPNFSEQLEGSFLNPQYALIPVGADWTGNENILGYPDGLDSSRYVSKPALEVILHAVDYPELPHFLILDEIISPTLRGISPICYLRLNRGNPFLSTKGQTALGTGQSKCRKGFHCRGTFSSSAPLTWTKRRTCFRQRSWIGRT